jgi:dienelactone hydrolase
MNLLDGKKVSHLTAYTIVGLAIFSAVVVVLGLIHMENHMDKEAHSIIVLAPTHDEQLWWVPVQSDEMPSKTYKLETMVYRPSGSGPFPLVTINHGKPTPGSDLHDVRPGYETAARWFVERGFAVAVPLRRGYGRSQGEASDLVGSCEDLDYFATARRTAIDLEAVIAFMQQQSFIIGAQVVAVGHSHGAFGLLGVAYDPPAGLRAIINFAGGTGDWAGGKISALFWRRSKICGGAEKLVAGVGKLGERNTLPQIWLYSENDGSFGPLLAQAMFKAYSEASQAPISLVSLPPWERDGHLLFMNGETTSWAPAVSSFLTSLHINGYD